MKLSKVSIIAAVPSLAYATLTHQEGERALKQDSIVRKPKASRKPKGSKDPKGSRKPSLSSTLPSSEPSNLPSSLPSSLPSFEPSNLSSSLPGTLPSSEPSNLPSSLPSSLPSNLPSSLPSSLPSFEPSNLSSSLPGTLPSSEPSNLPSSLPSSLPSFESSNLPSSLPSSLPSFEPSVSMVLSESPTNTPPLQFSMSYYHGCAVYSSKVQCVGYNNFGQVSDPPPAHVTTPVPFTFPEENSASPIKVVTGFRHTCVLMDNGSKRSVWCKGGNNYGQLGNETSSESSSTPVQVKNGDTVITNAVDIEAGPFHNCIKLDDNSLYCFGRDDYSQLGFNGEADLDVKLMALSVYATCIVKNSKLNEVLCKGDSVFNEKTYPMGEGKEIVKLVSGYSHFCVLLKSTTAKCFGVNFHGELGNGSTIDRYDSAVDVVDSQDGPPLSDITDINAGGLSTCLVVSNNTPMCFGSNNRYPLGIANGGLFGANVLVPTELDVTLPTNRGDIASIHVGEYTGHVVYPDNSVFSWGTNRYGGLGNELFPASFSTVIGDTDGEDAVEMNFNWN